MITAAQLIALGYESKGKSPFGKIKLTYYKFGDRKYQVSLTDDGILGVMFPINAKSKVKELVNETDWEVFLNWHNSWIE